MMIQENYEKISTEFLQFCNEIKKYLEKNGQQVELTEDIVKEWSVKYGNRRKSMEEFNVSNK